MSLIRNADSCTCLHRPINYPSHRHSEVELSGQSYSQTIVLSSLPIWGSGMRHFIHVQINVTPYYMQSHNLTVYHMCKAHHTRHVMLVEYKHTVWKP